MANFSTSRLNVQWGVGVSGGPEFSTTETISGSGYIYSNANWVDDVFSIDIGNRVIKRDEKDYLLAFFKNRKGKNQGFRFKNWSEFRGFDEHIGTGNGQTTQFQLFKNYAIDSEYTTKKISKPVAGTLSIKVNDVITTAWTCDYETGIVIFNLAPGLNLPVSASYEFDLPVKFGADKFELIFLMETGNIGQYQLGSLPIREVPV